MRHKEGKVISFQGIVMVTQLVSCRVVDSNPSPLTLASLLSPYPYLPWWLSLYLHRDRDGPAPPVVMMTCTHSDVALQTGPLIIYHACRGQRLAPIAGSKMTEWTQNHLVHHLCALLCHYIYSKWDQICLPLVFCPHCISKTMIGKPTICCLSKGLPNWPHKGDAKEKEFNCFKFRRERGRQRDRDREMWGILTCKSAGIKMPGDYIPSYLGEPLAQEWKEPGQMPLSNKPWASRVVLVVKNLPAMQEM